LRVPVVANESAIQFKAKQRHVVVIDEAAARRRR
jgi:hypothetical protein